MNKNMDVTTAISTTDNNNNNNNNNKDLCHSDACFNGFFHGLCNRGTNSQQIPSTFPSVVSKEFPEMKDARRLHAEEMNKLSLQEREAVYDDVHGVGDVIEENDEQVAYTLNQLEIEIQNIKQKSEYILAEQMSKEYVQDRKFRLMFLRSCQFDTEKAAIRLVKFFDLKLQLFGKEKLTKTITISDLNDTDMDNLMAGRSQVLPSRDRAGRTIVLNYGTKKLRIEDVDSVLRTVWYIFMALLEDEETQRRGIVNIFYWSEISTKPDPNRRTFLQRASQFSHALPYRVVSGHFVFDKATFLTLVALIMKTIISRNRARMRFHYGTHTECQFSLMTFGIPLHVFPITWKGDMKLDNHMKWIQRRRVIEDKRRKMIMTDSNNTDRNATSTTIITKTTIMMFYVDGGCIDLPTKYDVLLGRGKPIQNHTGNEYLRDLLTEYAKQYKEAKRGKKPIIADTIIQLIKKTSGRFLKQKEKNNIGWWYEVSDDIAREKVCSGFRTLRAR